MNVNKRFYTFIIASHADARLWRISLPYPILFAIACFTAIGIISAGTAAYRWGQMALIVQECNQLLAKNDSFRAENHSFRLQAAQLGEKIDFLETLALKLSIVSGINSEKSGGGIGGASREGLSPVAPASAAKPDSFVGYGKSLNALEDRLRGMNAFISGKALLASATPDRMPVNGYVSAGMGLRENPFNASVTESHNGLDISAGSGTPVRAPADGVVIFAGQREGYGNVLVIDHKFGFVTRYGHLSKMSVAIGLRVKRSDVIGYVGTTGRTTGPHLHYEVWHHNIQKDPRQYFSRSELE